MSHEDIRKKFLDFFSARGGAHAVVPSSSLIPSDPSVLLTTAGMQQFKPYYTGEADAMADFSAKNTVSIQKCFRTSDIDEVGDETHLTFFEMMGNFSFGGYWKKEAIQYGYDFITKEMGLDIEYVTVFDPEKVPAGDWRKNGVPFDRESYEIWKNIGMPEEKIVREGIDVFWGPTGNEGPCGPTTEIYLKNANGQAVEIWNIVFNEFYCDKDKKLTRAKTPGVDTGMGLERLAMISQGVKNIFETDLFAPIFDKLNSDLPDKIKRIVADHLRGVVFLVGDGVRPSNKEQGYILRRLMRRVITYAYRENLKNSPEEIMRTIVSEYHGMYSNLDALAIEEVYAQEYAKFIKSVGVGLKELEKLTSVDAASAFRLYESYGLPYEIIKEVAGTKAGRLVREEFDAEFKKHQEISRAGVEKKFGGHGLLLDTGELKAGTPEEVAKVTRLHTATHLLQYALRKVLGNEVKQMGSDITAERARFDLSFPRKLTPEEINAVENEVNAVIASDIPVIMKEMDYDEAMKSGALAFFKAKYPQRVKVYSIAGVSRELCGGPHVEHTGEIGKFKILKEEAISNGVRRIRAAIK
ncbi:MAG: alanine--tRNA ligase [Candidatus Niyogibacteria bacterium]|nr:alanine--tRNA ligase [Candidatus Niyogibacteria bacterium]